MTNYTICVPPRLAVMMMMCVDPAGAAIFLGIECSTFVLMNRGTSKRSALLPMGDTSVKSVLRANSFTSRHGGIHMGIAVAGFLCCRVSYGVSESAIHLSAGVYFLC